MSPISGPHAGQACRVIFTADGDALRLVRDFWNARSCGEDLYLHGRDASAYRAQSDKRYELETFIKTFADAPSTRYREVLEIGVGLGADHPLFAEAGAQLTGIDLTEHAVEHVRRRLDGAVCNRTCGWQTGNTCRLRTRPSTSSTHGVCCTIRQIRWVRSTRCGASFGLAA